MKAGRRLAAVVLFSVSLALLATPAGAGAKPGYYVTGPGYSARLHLRGSGGYAIQVTAYQNGEVTLTARKGSGMAWYSVKGKGADDGSIEARFPGLGEVAVAFKPHGEPERRTGPANCKGRGPEIQRGAFTGRIRFRGERSFTVVGSDHAGGRVVHRFKEACRRGAGGTGHKGPETHTAALFAGRPRGKLELSFTASRITAETGPLQGAGFSAVLAGIRHGMSEVRIVSASGGPDSFLTDPAGGLESATVSPSPPFTGSGEFTWTAGQSASWTGSLAVELPGMGKVALAGPSFASELCLDRSCTEAGAKTRGRFEGEILALPNRPQLSGSHSQAFGDARLSWSR